MSPDLISRVTDAVVDEVESWRSRPLDSVYPIVYLDALVVKIRDAGVVQHRSVYLVIGVNMDGERDVLGIWMDAAEGAKFWLSILTELKSRGVDDIFIICADGLKGMPQAVEAAFPKTIFQTCIVHLIRSSTRFVPWKERKKVCADLKAIYTASSVDTARIELDKVAEKWGDTHPLMVRAWNDRFEEWTPFLAFPPEIRRVIYTTNAIEAANRQIRKVLKTRGALPTEMAATKLIYLAMKNGKAKWSSVHNWSSALKNFAIHFADRVPL